MSPPALLGFGSVFRLREHSDFYYITKVTDKQIQYKPCVTMRVSPYTHLEGTVDWAYQAKLLPSPDSVKPSRMALSTLHPSYFSDRENKLYGMIECTVQMTTVYPKYDDGI